MLYKEQIGHGFALTLLQDCSVYVTDVNIPPNSPRNFALGKFLNFSKLEILEGKLTIYSTDTEENYVFISDKTSDYFVWELREIISR